MTTRKIPTPHPRGFPYIIANEAAERFSYYGMKAILVMFMTSSLVGSSGAVEPMTEQEATVWYHLFAMANYLFPLFGALLADMIFGKYRTILILSLVYCLGHLTLALDITRTGLALGLFLIALGAGGIKPCVSAHLGDQYRASSNPRITEGFSLFYLAINLGAFFSSLLLPVLLRLYGPHVAFGVPGLFMALATLVFWKGRTSFVALPPTPWREYLGTLWSPDGRNRLARLSILFLLVAIFWCLFDQTGSSWVLQAELLDRSFSMPLGLTVEILPAQLQAINPLLILALAPLFSAVVYPWLEARGWLSNAIKLRAGMLLAAISFGIVAMAQSWIQSGAQTSVAWQITAYALITTAEVLISITALELAYTQAPKVSTSLVMALFYVGVAAGNGITAFVNGALGELVGGPSHVSYFVFFAVLPLLGCVPIGWCARALERQSSL
jgi:POT family proton-dependent oligopeptide transporter